MKKIEDEIENNSKSKSFSIKHMVIKIIGTKYKKKKQFEGLSIKLGGLCMEFKEKIRE